MPMMKHQPVVFIFNSPLASGCDYVAQTMRIVSETHPSYGIALGDVISFPKWLLSRDKWIIRRMYGAMIVRPVSVFPGLRFRFVRQLTYMLTVLALRLFVDIKHRNSRKLLWYFEPFHIPALLPVLSGYTKIYDCVDYYHGFSELAKREHGIAMKKADLVFANSIPLTRKLKQLRPDVISVPLGFSPGLFASYRVAPISQHKNPFTVGYIGSLSDRIDFTLLHDVVMRLPSIRFIFIGPLERNVFGRTDNTVRSMRALLLLPNTTWIPSVPKKSIPSVLRRMDIGIIPYRDDLSFNRYSFPMKALEYFAAGRPVIAGNIASLYPYADKKLLTIATSTSAYIAAIRTYRLSGWRKSQQRVQIREAHAQQWTKKIAVILSYV